LLTVDHSAEPARAPRAELERAPGARRPTQAEHDAPLSIAVAQVQEVWFREMGQGVTRR